MARRGRRKQYEASTPLKRGGGIYPSLASLPPAPESIRRYPGLSELDALSALLGPESWGMGRSPIAARSAVGTWSYGRKPSTLLKAQFKPLEHLRLLTIRAPARVQFCVSRKSRRQVLFALGRAGARGSAPKRHYRRTQESQYSCR